MKILITAGGTREHIDPVRYITNASSGLQGLLLANEAAMRGHEVLLIMAPSHLRNEFDRRLECGVQFIDVISAQDMYEVAMEFFPSYDVAICSAAVGDYRVKEIATDKIKRNGDSLMLELVPNKDIAKELGAIKTAKQKVIGFALETNNGVENAKAKIVKKNLDFIVLNEITPENQAFESSDNIVNFIYPNGEIKPFEKMDKELIAKEIINELSNI